LDLEIQYKNSWNKEFKKRLKVGRIVAVLFKKYNFSEFMMLVLKSFPKLLPYIIKQTHGKPIKIDEF
jgi:hypothetical protein